MVRQVCHFILLLLLANSTRCQEAEDPLRDTIQRILEETFVAQPTVADDLHSLIVYQGNHQLYVEYFNGFGPDSLNNLKSITKSILGLLVGIAIEQGQLKSLEQPALDFFDDCELSEQVQAEKGRITIAHLLLMQAGIAWNNRALVKDDWWFNDRPHCFLLNEFPMDTLPGSQFSYNSAVAHLLSGILSRATGQSTLAFARQHLFGPLGIEDITWRQDRAGEYYGNSELALKPEDLGKIGQMLLNGGQYEGQRILSPQWIQSMTEAAQAATPLMNYGYLWMTSKTDEPPFYFAGGSGGQHLIIVPEKELIVVTTGHWDNARSTLEIMEMAVEVIQVLSKD